MSPATLQVFDPPMCCPTGACGPEPDPVLARFASDLAWLQRQGVLVERHDLGREPEVFARNPLVADAFRRRSLAALPLVIAGGETVSEGGYPDRAQLAARFGLAIDSPPAGGLRLATDPGCVPGSGCCG